jgi:hypothetical protein
MTYTLTTDQIADIRGDMGTANSANPVPNNADLDRLYNRAEGDYNLTVVYALRQLWAYEHRSATYVIGVDSLNKQKIFDNLEKMIKMWERIAGVQGGTMSAGVIDLGLDIDEADLDTFGTAS